MPTRPTRLLPLALLASLLTAAGCQTTPAPTPSEPLPESALCGAYTPAAPLDDTARALFQRATRQTPAEGWTPLDVSTQVVAGINYRFTARSAAGATFTLLIFEPLPCANAEPELLEITPLAP